MKVLIVDDNSQDRKVMRYYLENHRYSVSEAADGKEGLAAVGESRPDMIISDALMPVMDGFRFLRELKKNPGTSDIPFVFYSAVYTDEMDESLAKNLGADAFIVKPKDPEQFWAEVTEALKVAAGKGGVAEKKLLEEEEQYLLRYSEVVTVQLEKKVAELEQTNLALELSSEKLKQSLGGAIRAIGIISERRDPYTVGHEEKVADLAAAIAGFMGMDEEIVQGIRISAALHDIGKLYVPSEILSKPGKLTDAEFKLIMVHPQFSFDILQNLDFPWPVAEIVLQHHERMNGSGYPNALQGDSIKIEARILAVADVIEAMASHRPYRPAFPIEKALDEVRSHQDDLYDSKVVKATLALFKSGYELSGKS
jgi:putative two-component system response regulator